MSERRTRATAAAEAAAAAEEAAADPTIPAPVTGTAVAPPTAAVIPSASEQNAAADRAVGRTVVQVGIPTAVVGIGVWLMRLLDVDLDPGAGRDLPADVVGYFIAVATWAGARTMNPRRK